MKTLKDEENNLEVEYNKNLETIKINYEKQKEDRETIKNALKDQNENRNVIALLNQQNIQAEKEYTEKNKS